MTTQPNTLTLEKQALSTSPLFHRQAPLVAIVGQVFRPTTWRAFAYHVATFAISIIGFSYAITAVTLGLSLAVLILGLVVAAGMIVAARRLGTLNREITNSLMGTSILPPVAFQRGTSLTSFTRNGLADTAGWRSLAYSVLTFMTSMVSFTVSLTFFGVGIGGVTYGFWYDMLPAQQASDGSWHRGTLMFNDYYIDTPPRIAVYTLISAVVLFVVWPALNNVLAKFQTILAVSLLGPTPGSIEKYYTQLQQARAAAASDQRLRTIERDLHDVTQAQLVAIAMKLGDAKERLAAGESPEAVLNTLTSAHETSKNAITDLRGLVHGIHPAALNDGLEVALHTLAATSPLRIETRLDLTHDIDPAVESVAYYALSELLANTAKHSGTSSAQLTAQTTERSLDLNVTDQGKGGAQVSEDAALHGTGLRGVADRVESVGGSLHVESPQGGPTSVDISLPRTLKVEG